MSNIHIIAGPPGIGKSTLGYRFVPSHLDIINEDEMRYKYKIKGYPDYDYFSVRRVRDIIKRNLIDNEDFALELNLGFSEHYDYVLNLKHHNPENILNVVLFFTDDLDLCQDRAMARFKSGRHLVKPETIEEMYINTLPLLKDNFDAIDYLTLLDASRSKKITPVATYNKSQNTFDTFDDTPEWFRNDLQIFIQNRIDDDFLPKLDLGNPYEPDDDRPRGRRR